MSIQFCHVCGKQASDKDKFCIGCGTKLLTEETPIAAPSVEEVQEAPKPTPAAVAVAEPIPAATKPSAPPPVPAPVAVAEKPQKTAPSTPPKNSIYRPRGVGRTILAIFICLFLFVWTFGAVSLLSVSGIFEGNMLADTVEDVVHTSLSDMKAKDVLPKVKDAGNETVLEWVLKQVEENVDDDVLLEGKALDKAVEEFLEESTIVPTIAEKASVLVDDLLNDDDEFVITKKDVRKLLEDNRTLFAEKFNVELTDTDIDEIVSVIDDLDVLDDLESSVIRDEIEDELPITFELLELTVRYGWILFLVLTLLFLVLLAMTDRWNMLQTSADFGVVLVIVGSIILLTSLVGKFFVADIIPNDMAWLNSIIENVIDRMLLCSGITLGSGIVLILVKVVGMIFVRKHWKRQATV